MTNTHNEAESTVFGFTADELKNLHAEWKTFHTQYAILTKIATKVFNNHSIQFYDALNPDNIDEQNIQLEILTSILNIQELVLTKTKKTTKTVRHQKGDVRRDNDGNPILKSNGEYDLYDRFTIEDIETTTEIPLYSLEDRSSEPSLLKMIRTIMVLPDFKALRAKFVHSDYYAACDKIRELTKYWKFGDTEEFVRRFALFASNVKAKALGYDPKWPVLLSLVSPKMGIGKSWLANKIATSADVSFGTRTTRCSYLRLTGRFNAPMMTRGIIRIDEAVGMDKVMVEKMKNYITDTAVDIERKGLDQQTVHNRASMISTTNESVLPALSGNDQSRRVIEFEMDKITDIDESKLDEILNAIWELIPTNVPAQDNIIAQLKDETAQLLDSTMEDVVYDIFHNNPQLVKGRRLMKHEFKSICVQKKIPAVKVQNWCASKGLLDISPDGHITVLKKGLDTFLDQMDKDYAIIPDKVEADFEELLEGC